MAVVDISNTYQMSKSGEHIDNTDVYNSNRNLLDNPFFTVNQRNFTSSTETNNIYSVDRWYIARGTGTISKTSNGITINGVGASRETTFQQMIDCGDLTGRTVTLSVNDGGTIRQMAGEVPARTASNNIFIRFTLRDGVSAFLYAMATSSAYAYMLQFQVNAGYTLDLRAAKIELGSYSTLANDVPPNYGEELKKCQYFFRRITVQDNGFIALGWATSATAAQFPNILGTSPMRAKPSATPTGAVYVRDPSGTDHAVSSFTVEYDPVTVGLQANTSGLTANTVARLRLGAGGRIDLSADL